MKLERERFLLLFWLISLTIPKTVCLASDEITKTSSNGYFQNETKAYFEAVKHRTKRGSRIFVLCYKTKEGTPIVTKDTAEECVKYCWKIRRRVALIKGGNQCKCVENLQRATYTAMSGCQTPCVGDQRQNCGGKNKYAMYKTGYVREPRFRSKYSAGRIKKLFQGCYEKITRPQKESQLNFGRMTTDVCLAHCEDNKFNFASLSGGARCSCTISNKHLARIGEDSCRIPCKGDSSMKCGGDDNQNFILYKTPSSGSFRNGDVKNIEIPDWSRPKPPGPHGYKYFDGPAPSKTNNRKHRRNGNPRRKNKRNRKVRVDISRKKNKRKRPKSKTKVINKVAVDKPDATIKNSTQNVEKSYEGGDSIVGIVLGVVGVPVAIVGILAVVVKCKKMKDGDGKKGKKGKKRKERKKGKEREKKEAR